MSFSDMLVKRVYRYCQDNYLFEGNYPIICACSGGPDSVALLDIMLKIQKLMRDQKQDIKVVAAHYEHGIRGAESIEDAKFVEKLCKEWGVELYLGAGDVPAEAKKIGESIETTAREMRYDFLYEISASLGDAFIVTAHHKDDQAETVLMHLLRGSGIKGLGGILPDCGLRKRPLLEVSKSELIEYCKECGLEYRIDSTNEIPDSFRNKIRLELLPLLKEKYNPSISDALASLAKLAAADEEYLEIEAGMTYSSVSAGRREKDFGKDSTIIDRECFNTRHLAMQRRCLQDIANRLSKKVWDRAQIDAVIDWMRHGASGTGLDLPNGVRVEREYDDIIFFKVANVSHDVNLGKVEVEFFNERPTGDFGTDKILCDADKLNMPLEVRTRREGDVIQLPGGRKKLKELFIDIKLPRHKRDVQPVITSGDDIIWLPGIRQAKIAWTDENTSKYAVISYTRL